MNVRLPASAAPLAARLRSLRPSLSRRLQIALLGSSLAGLALFGVFAGGGAANVTFEQAAGRWVVPIANLGDAFAITLVPGGGAEDDEQQRAALTFTSVEDLDTHFATLGFALDEVREGARDVPRIIVARLPADLGEVTETDKRKRLFVATLLPLVLQSNERIAADRERLLRLSDRLALGLSLREPDREWLDELSTSYGVDRDDLEELRRRVDTVPVSLALAQAAEESGWGTSRFAKRGNALFGQYTTSDYPAMVARDRDDTTITVRAFEGIPQSVDSYMRNLNTHRAYTDFRKTRDQFRRQGHEPDARALLATLTRYSERGLDYVRTISSIIRANQFEQFDRARLTLQRQASVETTPLRLAAD